MTCRPALERALGKLVMDGDYHPQGCFLPSCADKLSFCIPAATVGRLPPS